MAARSIIGANRQIAIEDIQKRAVALAEQLGFDPPAQLPTSTKDLEMFVSLYVVQFSEFTLTALEALTAQKKGKK